MIKGVNSLVKNTLKLGVQIQVTSEIQDISQCEMQT